MVKTFCSVDLDLGGSAILPGQKVGTVAANHLPELLELGQREVLTILMGYPGEQVSNSRNKLHQTWSTPY